MNHDELMKWRATRDRALTAHARRLTAAARPHPQEVEDSNVARKDGTDLADINTGARSVKPDTRIRYRVPVMSRVRAPD